MNFDVNSLEMNSVQEASKVCEDIMDELLNSLPVSEESVSANAAIQEAPKTFFKALSFYDDAIDDDPILPFESFFDSAESTCVPSEFTQPFFNAGDSGLLNISDSESNEIVTSIIDSVLDSVLLKAVAPRKVATVHPFSLNNLLALEPDATENSSAAQQSAGLRLAGFAVDPAVSSADSQKPTLKLANFAVDPSASGTSTSQPKLKLANFAVDPANGTGADQQESQSSQAWHKRDGPPPLTQKPDQQNNNFSRPFPPTLQQQPTSNSQDAQRQLFSPNSHSRSPQPRLPSLTRAPSPHVGATPPPQTNTNQNLACFGHFERELEYRYCFRTMDCVVHPGYVIFSSLDNVYIKLIVHETGLQGLPRDPIIWQSVFVKFMDGGND